LKNNTIPGLTGYDDIAREVTVNDSRLDLVARNAHETAFIEVKNVTYKDGNFARFPDAVTTRGLKHLHNLIRIKAAGHRAVMVYVVQRGDVSVFTPAFDIDPNYAEALKEAYRLGVEIFPVRCSISPEEIEVETIIPFELDR